MPTIRIDPAVANNSLRVFADAEADGDIAGVPAAITLAGAAPQAARDASALRLNGAAIDAAKAVLPSERTSKLFEHLVAVAPAEAWA